MVMNDLEAYLTAYILIADNENRYGYVILFNLVYTPAYYHHQHVLLTLTHGENIGKK